MWMNKLKKPVVFPILDQFKALHESCVSLAQQIRVVTIFLFLQNLHHLTTDLTINFSCESRDEFHACTIEN